MKVLKFLIIGLILIGIAAGVAGVVLVKQMLQPVNSGSTEVVRFVVPKGQSISRIGERLAEEGLIKHPLVFRGVVRQLGAENQIQAGSFELTAAMTPAELIEAMTQGTDDTWVTLLEGWRREEMAESLAELELPNYDEAEFLELTAGKEGYLFPDTYLVQRSIATEDIVNLLLATFDKKVETDLAAQIAASGKPLDEIVTIASLIQREAKGDQQMRLVSGVLWNRIDIGMALNVDATLQYLKGYSQSQQSWWVPPLAVDKEIESPYNTYKYAGLPPAPIANPGLDAIKAALNPTDTTYLYYLHDNQGGIHFGETLQQHNANVQRYLR
ncbi:endolytic transglycosylase MltG [Patescibacteria group bacterium]|nr:endolytic transglycosylase MltG [Patescibacteria group bacterium]